MKSDQPVEIATEHLIIRPFTEAHITERYVGWLNDIEVVRYSKQRFKTHTIASCFQYYMEVKNSSNLFLAIEAKDPALGHIGNITVVFEPQHGLADLAIMIGEPSARRRGFGFEAWSATLTWLLQKEDVRKVIAGTVEKNVAMLSIMRRCGMTDDGIRKAHRVYDGNALDVHFFSAFRASAQRRKTSLTS